MFLDRLGLGEISERAGHPTDAVEATGRETAGIDRPAQHLGRRRVDGKIVEIGPTKIAVEASALCLLGAGSRHSLRHREGRLAGRTLDFLGVQSANGHPQVEAVEERA
jgi:hypothetical protein